jgi:hypothetical protein
VGKASFRGLTSNPTMQLAIYFSSFVVIKMHMFQNQSSGKHLHLALVCRAIAKK